MNLKYIKTEACPTCGCSQIVAESVEVWRAECNCPKLPLDEYTISVQFGEGNYCAARREPVLIGKVARGEAL